MLLTLKANSALPSLPDNMGPKLKSDAEPKDIARLPPPGIANDSRRKIWTPVAKDWVVFKKYGRETNGEYTLLTMSIAPGGENATHWYGFYSKIFTAERGDVGIYIKSTNNIILLPGESFTIIPEEMYYFFNYRDEEVEIKIKL